VDRAQGAGRVQCRQRVLVERPDDAGTQVGRGTYVQYEAPVHYLGEHAGVLDRADTVPDPGRLPVEDLPDGLRAGRLARVRYQSQAAVPGDLEGLAVRLRGRRRLEATEPEADDPPVGVPDGHPGDLLGDLRVEPPVQVRGEPDRHAVPLVRLDPAIGVP